MKNITSRLKVSYRTLLVLFVIGFILIGTATFIEIMDKVGTGDIARVKLFFIWLIATLIMLLTIFVIGVIAQFIFWSLFLIATKKKTEVNKNDQK